MRRACFALIVLVAGCRSVPINKTAQADLARADALVLQGCYDCLLDAQAIYEKIAVGKARPLVLQQLFEVELLIALREKELALDASAAVNRLTARAKELPPVFEANRYLAMVDAVPPDNIGMPRRFIEAYRRARVDYVPHVDDEIMWLETATVHEPVRRYLAISLDCAFPSRRRPPGSPLRPSERTPPADAPPLVLYRSSICAQPKASELERVRSAEPRFVESEFFLAIPALAMAQKDGGVKAKTFLADAAARFPKSPSVSYLSGNVMQLAGNCRNALTYYDATIALQPLHEDALLGRTVCLAMTKRFDEGIAAATRIISLDLDNVTEAYYWRAWIEYKQTNLAAARADTDRAKSIAGPLTLTINDIWTLAGVIEHDQKDLDPAEVDLRAARRGIPGRRNCTAMWYLGLVYTERERWIDSAAQFVDAMKCYELDVQEGQDGLQRIQDMKDLDPEFRASQIANFETVIKDGKSQQYASAFNAANHFARGGDLDKARQYLEIAAHDEALAKQVEILRAILKNRDVFDTMAGWLPTRISTRLLDSSR